LSSTARARACRGAALGREPPPQRPHSSLALNSNDRTIRVFHVDAASPTGAPLIPIQRFQDLVNKTPWAGCGFSADGEYALGGAANKASHQLFIWYKTTGTLAKTLEGPPDPLVDFCVRRRLLGLTARPSHRPFAQWHPTRPIVATATNVGVVHIWTVAVTERWAAYAPGFEELDENTEYAEREEEFDIVRSTAGRLSSRRPPCWLRA
jgi:COMPASS component SWD1